MKLFHILHCSTSSTYSILIIIVEPALNCNKILENPCGDGGFNFWCPPHFENKFQVIPFKHASNN